MNEHNTLAQAKHHRASFIRSSDLRMPSKLGLSETQRDTENVVGLLAGSGRFPILFAEAARRQGIKVACVGIKYEAHESLASICHDFNVVGISKLGKMIRMFKGWGVGQVVMAGKVTKSVMYTPWRMIQLWPDWRMLHYWYVTCRMDKKDDSLLLGVIAEFERDGIHFSSALDYCPELLVNRGILTRRQPTASEDKDIAFGWHLAKEMGRLDVGQSVAVKERAALAVEAIEGTDRCIERAGKLCPSGGWTLVKVAKPQQDMRFDVPTIGVSTVENLHKARANVLAIEAGKTIVIDQADVVALADRYGITIVALPSDAVENAN
jgi:DUF1009 family protein